MKEPTTLLMRLCRLTGHRLGGEWLERDHFTDIVTGKVVGLWICACGYVWMTDGRWQGRVALPRLNLR